MKNSIQKLSFISLRMNSVVGIAIAAASVLTVNTVAAENFYLSREFNEPGNILIADQFNNRVIEATPSGKIVWSFGLGPNDFSSNSIIRSEEHTSELQSLRHLVCRLL